MLKKIFLLIASTLLLTACSKNQQQEFHGYIEGRFNYLSSNYAGTLIKLLAQRGEAVKIGQALAILDQEPQKAALEGANENLQQAEAQAAQIKANLTLAELTLERNQTLFQKRVIQQEAVDIAKTNRDALQAQLRAANANLSSIKASLSQAKWSYSQKIITAPIDGEIFDTYYEIGEVVPPNHPVLGLLAPQNIYLVFFIPESFLSQINIGKTLKFKGDSFKQFFPATIRFISPNTEYTPPVIYSRENRQKLVYRVEASITPEIAKTLHPGQPIDIFVTFRS